MSSHGADSENVHVIPINNQEDFSNLKNSLIAAEASGKLYLKIEFAEGLELNGNIDFNNTVFQSLNIVGNGVKINGDVTLTNIPPTTDHQSDEHNLVIQNLSTSGVMRINAAQDNPNRVYLKDVVVPNIKSDLYMYANGNIIAQGGTIDVARGFIMEGSGNNLYASNLSVGGKADITAIINVDSFSTSRNGETRIVGLPYAGDDGSTYPSRIGSAAFFGSGGILSTSGVVYNTIMADSGYTVENNGTETLPEITTLHHQYLPVIPVNEASAAEPEKQAGLPTVERGGHLSI